MARDALSYMRSCIIPFSPLPTPDSVLHAEDGFAPGATLLACDELGREEVWRLVFGAAVLQSLVGRR